MIILWNDWVAFPIKNQLKCKNSHKRPHPQSVHCSLGFWTVSYWSPKIASRLSLCSWIRTLLLHPVNAEADQRECNPLYPVWNLGQNKNSLSDPLANMTSALNIGAHSRYDWWINLKLLGYFIASKVTTAVQRSPELNRRSASSARADWDKCTGSCIPPHKHTYDRALSVLLRASPLGFH